MTYAKIIADSVSPLGDRLTTMELEYPRFIHGELMTHRRFSRNAASSRAIPTNKLIQMVRDSHARPSEWGSNQPGMQAGPLLDEQVVSECEIQWALAADAAADHAEVLLMKGVHKQVVNRILEPFMWMKTIVSSTEWDNFFDQRITGDSQPEMRELALDMRNALNGSKPQYVGPEEWHTPYLTEDIKGVVGRQISAARCARVSYLQHDGTRAPFKDLDLYDRLIEGGHWSPLEHVATPGIRRPYGNFAGWTQLRHSPEDQ